MAYETEVGGAKVKSAAPVKVKRTLDGAGKGDTPRPVDRDRWDVGYIRAFAFARNVKKAQNSLGLWEGAVAWLQENAPEFVAEAARRREADPDKWMEDYWWGRDAPIVKALRRNRFGEQDFGVEDLAYIYPALLEAAAES